MKKNMGAIDRLIRTIIAVIIVMLIFTGTVTSTLSLVLGIFKKKAEQK